MAGCAEWARQGAGMFGRSRLMTMAVAPRLLRAVCELDACSLAPKEQLRPQQGHH